MKNNWRKEKLGDICEIFSGSSAPQASKYFDINGEPFVRVSDLGNTQNRILIKTRDRVNQVAIKEKRLVSAKKGTAVFPKSGAAILTNSRAILGTDAYIVGHLAALYPKDGVDSVYLYYFLCGIDMKDYVPNIGYPSLNLSTIKGIIIPMPFKNNKPDLAEQKRIAEKIDKLFSEIDKGIEKTEEALGNSQKILQSELKKIFSNKDFKTFNLEDLLNINWGNTSITKKQYIDSGYPAYSAKGQDGFLKGYDYSGEAIILSAIGARCGKCFLANGRWTAIKNTIVIKAKDDNLVNYKYFFYYLNDENKWKSKGAGQPFISQEKANKMSISVPVKNNKPDLEEQKKIVLRLDKIQEQTKKLEEKNQEQLENLKQLKQSILNQAFQGKL